MAFIFRMYAQKLASNPLLVTSISSCVCYGAGDQLAQYIELKTHKREKIDPHRTANMALFGLAIGGPLYHMWFKKVHHIDKLFESLVKWNYERQLKAKLVNSFTKHIKDGQIDTMSMKQFRDTHKSHFDKMNNEIVFRSKTILAGQVYADQFIFSAIYPVIFMMVTGVMIDNTKQEDWEYLKTHKFFNTEKINSSITNNWTNVKNKYLTIYATDCAVWPLIQIANFAFVPSVYQPIFVNFVNIYWNAFICFVAQGH